MSRRGGLPAGRGSGWFALAGAVNATGTGFYYPFALLFLQEQLDVPLTSIGVGLTVAALLALPAMPLAGLAIDRYGPRTVLILSALIRAAAFAGLVAMHDVTVFVCLSIVVALCTRTEQAATPALAAALAPPGQAGRWLALSRVVFNAGFGGGALLASVAIGLSGGHFAILAWANALSFAAAVLCYLPIGTARRTAGPRPVATRRPWRNRRFLAVTGVSTVLWVIALGLEVGLPVFLLRQLGLSGWTVGALFAVNTGLLTVLQLPVSARLEGISPRILVAVGALLHVPLIGTLLLAHELSPTGRVISLVGGMVVYTVGELVSSQAVLVLLTSTSPAAERGAYLAFQQVFIGLGGALVPIGVTSLLDRAPAGLWWLLLAAAGTVTVGVAAVGSAEHGRSPRRGRSPVRADADRSGTPQAATGRRPGPP